MSLFACLGISALGECNYNPGNPAVVYFTLGDAIAALVFTIAVPQFLQPLYRLRLNVRLLTVEFVYAVVFIAVVCVVWASILPNLPIKDRGFFTYPFVYELLATALFVTAYAAIVIGSVLPIKITTRNVERFTKKFVNYVANNPKVEYASLTDDVARNFVSIAKIAGDAEEFRDMSPFREFSDRKRLMAKQYAMHLMDILADEQVVSTFVEHRPFACLKILRQISEEQLSSRHVRFFVQRISTIAIQSPNSLMARESGYVGFSRLSLFSSALFENPFILENCSPFEFMRIDSSATGALERFCSAVDLAWKTSLDEGIIYSRHLYAIKHAIEGVHRDIRRREIEEKKYIDGSYALVSLMNTIVRETRVHVEESGYNPHLFLRNLGSLPEDYVSVAAGIITDLVQIVANDFSGVSDQAWNRITVIVTDVFPRSESMPGVDALQQNVAVKLLDEMANNERGYYPATSRVLIGLLGPFKEEYKSEDNAFALFVRCFYDRYEKILTRMQSDRKFGDHMTPPNVSVDHYSGSVTHHYFRGSSETTKVRGRDFAPIDLLQPSHWRGDRGAFPAAGPRTKF